MIRAIVEYNAYGYLVYAEQYPGAYGRGATQQEALTKLVQDVKRYCLWCHLPQPEEDVIIVEEQKSACAIEDADTELLFHSEKAPLNRADYECLKQRVIHSAIDFQALYTSIPKKLFSDIPNRKTFYGMVCRTPREMYQHTNDVTAYYMGELQVSWTAINTIAENRIAAFAALEKQADFLQATIYIGNHQEQWTLKKVMRRFLWHDAIHAKAMYRLGIRTWGTRAIADPFLFHP